MYKIVGLFKKKPGMTDEEFSRHWQDVHGKLVMEKQRPLGIKYTQTHGLRKVTGYTKDRGIQMVPGEEQAYDAIAETWFEDWDSLQAVIESLFTKEAGKALLADWEKFGDLDSFVIYVGEERVIYE
jgi:uncharacterized protein (TIGR02118 family)